jgi:hypothetical protein
MQGMIPAANLIFPFASKINQISGEFTKLWENPNYRRLYKDAALFRSVGETIVYDCKTV